MKSSQFISFMEEAPKVEYLPCQKKGYHYGEVLNMICLEPGCHDSMLCCCACVQEQHKNHNTKPLRLILLEAGKAAKNMVPVAFDFDGALEKLNSHQKLTSEMFQKFREDIVLKLNIIEKSLKDYYTNIKDQVKLKNMDPKEELEKAFHIIQAASPEVKSYLESVQIVASLVTAKKEDKILSKAEINKAIDSVTDQMKKIMKAALDEMLGRITHYCTSLSDISKNVDVWKQMSFKFSSTTKHPDIKIISDLVVKSTNSSGYKFAIMQPSLEGGPNIKEIGFKIKESTSNWVAVGMCHKDIVAGKNFGFNFSTIGHGAYMVSANGGSWSNTKVDQNNGVKSFKFGKGDIISARINFSDKTMTFKKANQDKQSYILNFTTINGDELYPCALFYYLNDEIEFLPNHKF